MRETLEEMADPGVAALVKAIDERDEYTGAHSAAVDELARRVARRLGVEASELWQLGIAARLHDVGKIGVPVEILNKPGPLDEHEWQLMRTHAELGADIVAKIPGLEPVARFVRYHHERWDGRGYPDGLRGPEIPLGSRVIGACDAFHAMTTDRPYRRRLSVDAALAELTAGSGEQFDPGVVAAIRHEVVPASV
jgi:putative nucleotidyltransferase with HDIG domain